MGQTGTASRVARVRVSQRDPLVRIVEVEGVGTFRLDAETVHTLALTEGAEIDASLADRIAEAAARQQGRAIALRLLQRRLRSRTELEAALRRRGVPKTSLPAIMTDLVRAGWIDDVRFARAWIQDRMALRPSGRRRLRAELVAHGVAPRIADEAIAAMLTADREEELILVQAKARFRRLRGLAPSVARRRLIGWLQRRGFGSGAIARALRALQGANVDNGDVDPSA